MAYSISCSEAPTTGSSDCRWYCRVPPESLLATALHPLSGPIPVRLRNTGTGSWRALVSRGTRVASRSRRPRPRRSREFHICRGDAPIQRRSDLGRARWRCGAKVGQSGAASFVPGQIRKNRDRQGPSTLRCERGETIAERTRAATGRSSAATLSVSVWYHPRPRPVPCARADIEVPASRGFSPWPRRPGHGQAHARHRA